MKVPETNAEAREFFNKVIGEAQALEAIYKNPETKAYVQRVQVRTKAALARLDAGADIDAIIDAFTSDLTEIAKDIVSSLKDVVNQF